MAWGDSELRWRWLRIHSSQGKPNPEGKGLRTGCGLEGGEGVSGATVSEGNPSQEAGGLQGPLFCRSAGTLKGVSLEMSELERRASGFIRIHSIFL